MNIINLDAEAGASLLGDDAQPTLELYNSSTGAGIKAVRPLFTGGATIASLTTEGLPITFARTVIGSPSVALAAFNVSGASIPVFEFKSNALVSAVSLVFAASANWAGMAAIRVKYSDGTTYGWIPVLPSACVTAAAI